jgi:coproporphyrinogen III oxidase
MELNKNDVKIRENISTDVPRHEVLLSFNENCHGEAFREWWQDTGVELFGEWCKSYYYLKHRDIG